MTTGLLGVSGTITAAGSVQMKAAGDLTLKNATITSSGTGQRMRFESAASMYLGNIEPTMANIGSSTAVILEADKQIELIAGQTLRSGVDSEVYTRAEASRVLLQGRAVAWGGLAMAGVDYDLSNQTRTWTGKDSTLEIRADTSARLGGGKRLDNNALVAAGANLWASGSVRIRAGSDSSGIGVSLAAPSSIVADAKFNAAWSGTPDGQIDIFAEGQVQLSGAVEARDAGADISIVSGSLVLIDALVSAADQLSVRGGTHSSGQGIVQTPVVRDAQGAVVSGGVLDTQTGGTITLRSVDSMLLRGLVGQVVTSAARTSVIDAESSAGDITITGLIDSTSKVSLIGRQVNLLPGSHAFANNAGSDTYLRGRESILVAGEGPQQLEAMVKGYLLAHLAAPTITITGIVEATGANGRVLLNAGEQLRVNGRVKAMATGGKLVMQAGVDQTLTRAQMEAQGLPTGGGEPTTVLKGGFLQVLEQGLILSDTDVVMRSGGDVMLQADAAVKGEKTILVPQIAVRNEQVNVVTGSVQVDAGTILVPRITYVTTTSIEQIGEARVKVGSEFATMDVTLEQVGYYNPNAREDRRFVEYLVEGIDYKNAEVTWTNANNVETGAATAAAVTGDYKNTTAYKTFENLDDNQRQAVLNYTGYMPLYRFKWGNAVLNKTFNGQATTTTPYSPGQTFNSSTQWRPTWHAAAEKVYYVEVAGWRDKYILMPEGSQNDVYSAVSQGNPLYLVNDVARDGENPITDGNWVTSVVTATVNATTVSSSTTITLASPNSSIAAGQTVTGLGIPSNTSVVSVNGTTVVLSQAATASATVSVVFGSRGELVGRYKDLGGLTYTQTISDYYFPNNGYPGGYNEPHAPNEDGEALWDVAYDRDGQRQFDVTSRAAAMGTIMPRDPNWFFTQGPNFTKTVRMSDATTGLYQSVRFTDDITALPTWRDTLQFDTSALDQSWMTTIPNQLAFSFKYWGAWETVVGWWVDNDDGSSWSGYDEEEEVPHFGWTDFYKSEWGAVSNNSNQPYLGWAASRWNIMKMVGNGDDRYDNYGWGWASTTTRSRYLPVGAMVTSRGPTNMSRVRAMI